MPDGSISHDKFTHFLADGEWSSKDLRKQVKSTVREVESDDGILIFDETVLTTRREKRRSEVTKNELLRSMIDACMKNRIKFTWVLFDSWFSSVENLKRIKLEYKKEMISVLQSNRLVTLNKKTEEDHKNKRFTHIDQINWPERKAVAGWLNGLTEARAFCIWPAHG